MECENIFSNFAYVIDDNGPNAAKIGCGEPAARGLEVGAQTTSECERHRTLAPLIGRDACDPVSKVGPRESLLWKGQPTSKTSLGIKRKVVPKHSSDASRGEGRLGRSQRTEMYDDSDDQVAGTVGKVGLLELYRTPSSLHLSEFTVSHRALAERPLRLLIVGHNPSNQAWAKGHYYANPCNRMWHLLSKVARVVPSHFTAKDDWRCPDVAGVGFTDLMTGIPETKSCLFTDKEVSGCKESFFARLVDHVHRASVTPTPANASYPNSEIVIDADHDECSAENDAIAADNDISKGEKQKTSMGNDCAAFSHIREVNDCFPRVIAFAGVRQWRALFNGKVNLAKKPNYNHNKMLHVRDPVAATAAGDNGPTTTGTNKTLLSHFFAKPVLGASAAASASTPRMPVSESMLVSAHETRPQCVALRTGDGQHQESDSDSNSSSKSNRSGHPGSSSASSNFAFSAYGEIIDLTMSPPTAIPASSDDSTTFSPPPPPPRCSSVITDKPFTFISSDGCYSAIDEKAAEPKQASTESPANTAEPIPNGDGNDRARLNMTTTIVAAAVVTTTDSSRARSSSSSSRESDSRRGKGRTAFGIQTQRPEGWPECLRGSIVFLLPSSSGAAALSNEEREAPYRELGELVRRWPWPF